ncbi:MAG: ATP-binding protein [Acidobacteria bacterium]|nr:ATP-binding protein [Acidobacteriota bacterium]
MGSVQHRTDLVFRYAVVVVGLLLAMPATSRAERLPIKVYTTADGLAQNVVNRIVRDSRGFLWFCTEDGLSRYDGYMFTNYGTEHGLPNRRVKDLLETREGEYWVATGGGLCRFNPKGRPLPMAQTNKTTDHGPRTTDDLMFTVFYLGQDERSRFVTKLLQDRAGTIWCGTMAGLFRLERDGGQITLTPVDIGMSSHYQDGRSISALCEDHILSLTEDQYSNLWMATNAGAMKLARSGFVTFGEEDGFIAVNAIFENTSGELCVVGEVPGNLTGSVVEGVKIDATDPTSIIYWRRLGQFDGHKFTWVRPNAPKRITWFFGWGWNQIVLQDHTGEWWIMASSPWGELYRFPKINRFEDLKTIRPKAVYTTHDGLPTLDLFRLFEDARGDIWISGTSSVESGLARWARATETLHDMARTEGLPSLKGRTAISFRDDRAGNLWIGFSWGGLARYRDGRFTFFTTADGLPAGWIYDLYIDQAGRLWIASTLGGLARLDDPGADRLVFTTYTTADGLSSNKITCITEDQYGHLYVGTSRGLDRLTLATGRVKHFTSADGLIPGEIVVLFRDRKGYIWAGGHAGVSRYIPHPDPPPSPPPILTNSVRIRGVRHTISALGETTVSLPNLAADKNQLQIDFVGLSFASGESLRYQYKLEGADADWSAPTDQRTISYANLAPGHYRFLVRAINSDGVASPTPATVTFTILRPIWQRWWFLALTVAFVGLSIYVIYRYRLARLVELERVRTRIATDLHDDIGTGLSQMALLSDVVKRQIRSQPEASEDLLTDIARTGRELVDAMSDIVWAIDPRRDDLRNVVYRVRQLATDVLDIRGIRWELHAPEESEKVKLNPEQRRHVYLIFKEAITNIVRHADCSSVRLSINVSDHRLVAEIRDDGAGFAVPHSPDLFTRTRGGNGLVSMRGRAAELAGQLQIDSTPGCGTHLTLTVPLR